MKIRRFVVTIDGRTGKTINRQDIDTLPSPEKNDILQKVFTQGLERLGYQKTNNQINKP